MPWGSEREKEPRSLASREAPPFHGEVHDPEVRVPLRLPAGLPSGNDRRRCISEPFPAVDLDNRTPGCRGHFAGDERRDQHRTKRLKPRLAPLLLCVAAPIQRGEHPRVPGTVLLSVLDGPNLGDEWLASAQTRDKLFEIRQVFPQFGVRQVLMPEFLLGLFLVSPVLLPFCCLPFL